VEGLTAALKLFVAGAGLRGIPFGTMVMLIGPGEKEDSGRSTQEKLERRF